MIDDRDTAAGRFRWRLVPAIALVFLVVVGVGLIGVGLVGASEHPDVASQDRDALNESLAEPNVSVYLPENEVATGADERLLLEVTNEAHPRNRTHPEDVLPARSVTLAVTDPGPFALRTDRTTLGTLQAGTVSTAEVGLTVPPDLEPGTYEIETRTDYAYIHPTDEENVTRPANATQTMSIEVRPGPRFELETVDSDVRADVEGEVTIEITNTGTETATAAEATIAGGGGLVVDDGSTDVFLGTLDPGEVTEVTVDARLTQEASLQDKPIEATVSYRDPDDITRESPRRVTNVTPGPEQRFDILNLDDTLSVGYEGELTGTFRNDGPDRLEDGVLVLEPATDTVFVEERRYALPELDPGEETEFTYRADVSGQADPGPRQIGFTLEYASGGSDPAVSDRLTDRVVVQERQPEFDVTGGVTVTAGESAEVVLEVTNTRPETLSDINAELYADEPLAVDSKQAYISELDPGESADVRFEITADSGVMAKTYPIELDFQYKTPGGDTRLSDTYQHPVELVEPDDDGIGGMIPIAIGMVVLLAAAIGVLLYRRRR